MHGSAHRASRLSRFMPYWQGKTYTFDSFECAIHKLAPICAHCSVRIIGHGMEKSDRMFCCVTAPSKRA